MYQFEDALRHSPYYQDSVYRLGQDPVVEQLIQLRVLEAFDYLPCEHSLSEYHAMTRRFRDDPEIRQSVVYMRHNVMHSGRVSVGDLMMDVPLVESARLERTTLLSIHAKSPLIVIAGSIT